MFLCWVSANSALVFSTKALSLYSYSSWSMEAFSFRVLISRASDFYREDNSVQWAWCCEHWASLKDCCSDSHSPSEDSIDCSFELQTSWALCSFSASCSSRTSRTSGDFSSRKVRSSKDALRLLSKASSLLLSSRLLLLGDSPSVSLLCAFGPVWYLLFRLLLKDI